MVDHIGDASERRGRIDVRTGIGRRRRWSDEAKGRVVAESYIADRIRVGTTRVICTLIVGPAGKGNPCPSLQLKIISTKAS